MKILVVRFSSIGDIILTTPVVRILSKQLKAEIHYLTKQKFSEVLSYNPYIQKIWTINKDIQEVADQLKLENFDLVVDLHNNLRSMVLKRKLSVPSRSFHKANVQKWLMTNLHVDQLPKNHIVDRYLDCITSFALTNDGDGLDYFYSEETRGKVRSLMAEYGLENYICVVIGAAVETKCMPVDRLVEMIGLLNSKVVLIGGPGEVQKGQDITENVQADVVNLVGTLTLDETAACIDQSNGVITHDTGAMHMAAAFKKPTAVLWGNTIPGFGMYPYYGKTVVKSQNFEVNGLSCRPCSKIGYNKCPKGHFKCMEDQDLERVASFVNGFE